MSIKTFFCNLLWRDVQPTIKPSCHEKKNLMYGDENNFAAYSVNRKHAIVIYPRECVAEVSAVCNVLFVRKNAEWCKDEGEQRVIKWDCGKDSVSLKSNIETSIPLIEESWNEIHQRNQPNAINNKSAHIVFDNSLDNQDLVFAVDITSSDKSVGKRVWISKKGREVNLEKERPTDLPTISADEMETFKAIKPKGKFRWGRACAIIGSIIVFVFTVIERVNALFDLSKNIKT